MQSDDTHHDPAPPRRLTRSRTDRVFGGVCGGLAEYFGIDAVIVRLAAVALLFAGGLSALLYAAALLLVPNGPGESSRSLKQALNTVATTIGIVVISVLGGSFLFDPGLWSGWLAPAVVLVLLLWGVWSLASGKGAAGTERDASRRLGFGLALLSLVVLAAIAFWGAAAGGGTVAAALVIGAGAALVGAAFAPGGRRLVAPALAAALPAAFVGAVGVDSGKGTGDRGYLPGTADQVERRYEHGIGQLVIDLRDVDLPPGDRRLDVDLGIGEAVVVVPDDVCVATEARLGIGEVRIFGRDHGGVDVDWVDRPVAAPGNPRLVVGADIGLGRLRVGHVAEGDSGGRGWTPGDARELERGNVACLPPS